MSKKNSILRHLVYFEGFRARSMTESPDHPTSPPQHQPIPKRKPDRPPETIPQPIVPHPGSDPQPEPNTAPDPGPAPITMWDGQFRDLNSIECMKRGMRNRGFVTTHFVVRRVRRMIPMKSATVGLRHRNLRFKRKLYLVWN